MSTFILYKKNFIINENNINKIFSKKKLTNKIKIEFDDYIINIYNKTFVETQSIYTKGDHKIFGFGSYIYKEYKHDNILINILQDYVNNNIDYDNLYGNYCFIIYFNGKFEIILDTMKVFKIYANKDISVISSSFLALCVLNNSLSLNKYASYEKFVTGYNIGEETIFNEIVNFNDYKHKNDNFNIINNKLKKEKNNKDIYNNIESNLNYQYNILSNYFDKLKILADSYGAQLGLSGGYDSRLILAGIKDKFKNISLYTHHTEGVERHEIEAMIANSISKDYNIDIVSISTSNVMLMDSNEFINMIEENILFYDGRCTDCMGAVSETYTLKYRENIHSGYGVLLNGLGGEIYRNDFKILRPYLNFESWLKSIIFPPCVEKIFSNKILYKSFYKNYINKLNKIANLNIHKYVDKKTIRKYYAYVKLPYCDGLNANANSVYSFYFFPFIEKMIIDAALTNTKYLGYFGQYQTKLINKFDYKLTEYSSHYGHPLNKPSTRFKIMKFIRGYMPSSILKYLRNRNYDKLNDFNKVMHLINEHRVLKISFDKLQKLFKELNLLELSKHYEYACNMLFVSYMLYYLEEEYKVKIK